MESLSPKLLNQEDLRDKDAYKAVECLRNALLDARRGNIRNIALWPIRLREKYSS